jgi:hypothetical protein
MKFPAIKRDTVVYGCHKGPQKLFKRGHGNLSGHQNISDGEIAFVLDEHGRRVGLGSGAYAKVTPHIVSRLGFVLNLF